ncbi:gliding motility protein GldL [Flavobacteriaceae bacterium]|nr:gliding motility protein GldL [Flavobacteriaceae bacterium]
MALKINKKVMNMAYGLGAAVVIIGALMKIIHKDLGPLSGNTLLTIGLVTEALIFALSAFDTPDVEYKWEKVYPGLIGDKSVVQPNQDVKAPADLQKKYNEQISKATDQMKSLNDLYKSQLESAAQQAEINTESIENANKVKEQMESLASNLSSLNGVYGGMLSAMNTNK